MQKIAVPSEDGVFIADHFGRCASFVVFETDEGRILRTETRPNGVTAFAQGECRGGEEQGHGHSHAGIVEALHDCSVILCRGMGWRAAEAIKANGIEPFMVESELPAREAVEAYLAGSLRTGASFCRCHH